MMDVVVVGGGAAGFFGAIACAETFPQARVTLLEATPQPLSKVRVSGGGRCNVTHACFDPALLVHHYPRGGKELRGAFSRFQPRDTMQWFEARGIALKTEADGRMFPVTDDSATIINGLLAAAKAARVKLWVKASVKSVVQEAGQFRLGFRTGESIRCDRLLLATGSHPQGYAIARSLGHTLEPPVPSLFTFNIQDSRLAGLAGVSVAAAQLRLQIPDLPTLEQTGPLLITHWGLSGPAVLKLSAWAARSLHQQRYQAELQINWVATSNPETLRQQFQALRNQIPRKTIIGNCPVLIPRRLWERLVETVGIQPSARWAELSNKTLNALLEELTQGRYQISGKGAFKEEFVTCGGVSLNEVDFKTMQSRCCPGLFLAGEILDIDGVTGGFNFQAAWTTGWLAGTAMGREV